MCVIPEREPACGRLPRSRTVRVLGLTGPAASGKSYLLGLLRDAGAHTIEADAVYAALTQAGSPLLAQVGADFPGAVAPDGSLDRAELGRRVFADPEALDRLNRIVHPPLGRAIAEAVGAAREAGELRIAIEAAVLFEIEANRLCGEVWFVDCAPEERIRRLQASRGWDEGRARRLVSSQGPMTEVRGRCDRVLDGAAPRDELVRVARKWSECP